MRPDPLVQLVGVRRAFHRGPDRVLALDGIDLSLHGGEVVALVGPSGSGKTTLLTVVCGWEEPDEGRVGWGSGLEPEPGADQPWASLAVIPQGLCLTEELTVRENVALPARLSGRPGADVDDVLDRLALAHVAGRASTATSLGEQQRTAVARALVAEPSIVVADEPTAHQDETRAQIVVDALRGVAHRGGAVLVATHDPLLVGAADRVVTLASGRVAAPAG